jgi:hypothetical protein
MMGRAGPRGDWGETSWACDGGLPHFSSWFTLAGWVMVLVVGGWPPVDRTAGNHRLLLF